MVVNLGSNEVWGKIKGFFWELYADKVRMFRVVFTPDINSKITKFEDYGGTHAGTVKVTSAGHGLASTDHITINGTTHYNATYVSTKIDANTFYITATWVSNDATGNIYKMYTTGGVSVTGNNYALTDMNLDSLMLDPDATCRYVFDKANGKIIMIVTATGAELSNNSDISLKVIYGTVIGK